ncbi:MAG TPA: archaemetzincin family Zn-dependent metalloprotease [candidate division Zixibacteria bacterium]
MHLYILPLRFSDKNLLIDVSSALNDIFGLPVIILQNPFSLDEGRDVLRNQVNSTWILSQLLKSAPTDPHKILGITELDLHIPVLTYVFGEAQLEGEAAVISSYRLRDELYGLPKNQEKLKDRLRKEAIHELGHTFGLIHCRNILCVMHPSTYAEEIDFKSMNFCKSCASILESKKKGSITKP